MSWLRASRRYSVPRIAGWSRPTQGDGVAEAGEGTSHSRPKGRIGCNFNSAGEGHSLGSRASGWDGGMGGGQHTNTHSQHMVHSTHRYTDTALDTHSQKRDHTSATHTHTHTHTKRRRTPRNTPRDGAVIQHTEARRHTLTHVHSHTRPAGRPHKVAESTEEGPGRPRRPRCLPRATGGVAVRPPRARPGPPGLGPRPAVPGAAAARPSPPAGLSASRGPPRPPPAPGPARSRPLRPAAPAPPRIRRPPLRAELAKQQTARHVGVGGRRPTSLPPEPQARPDLGGERRGGRGRGRLHDNLFRARAPPTHAHTLTLTHGHTHTLPPPPRAAPGTLLTMAPACTTLATFLDTQPATHGHTHTHIRSRHAPTHAFPAHLAFTRTHVAPGGAHHQPQTLPHVHIAHTAHGHTRSGPFPRLHTRTRVSQAHTHRTPVPCCTCGHNPQSTPCHTQNTNAQPIRGYTTNSTPS